MSKVKFQKENVIKYADTEYKKNKLLMDGYVEVNETKKEEEFKKAEVDPVQEVKDALIDKKIADGQADAKIEESKKKEVKGK